MISGLFLLSSLLVIVMPGPDAALILRTVLRYGRRAQALAAAVGMILAGAGHAALSVSGMTLVLATDPKLFGVVCWIGASALFFWGIWTLRESTRPAPAAEDIRLPASTRWSLLLGLLSTASNPKVGVFLIAFLPQFVRPDDRPVPTMLILATIYLSMGAAWLVILTELIMRMRQRLFRPALVRIMQQATGLLFMAFAARLALG